VYIINAHDCYSAFTKSMVALVRNRLFTAITRSKAWVRVLGVGPRMDALTQEWERLKEQDYKLTFTYPTDEQKKELRLINVDSTPRQIARERKLKRQHEELLQAARSGDIDVDKLIEDLKKARAPGK
ncbi:MAG: helicase, partial [Paraburkholderia sp.]